MTSVSVSSGHAGNEEKGDAYRDPKGCLMIFDGSMAYKYKHRQKLTAREVNVAALGEAIPTFLKWSETMIAFDRKDHPDHISQLGRFPLVVDLIIGMTRLSRVFMDGGSGLNLLYTRTYDAMVLS